MSWIWFSPGTWREASRRRFGKRWKRVSWSGGWERWSLYRRRSNKCGNSQWWWRDGGMTGSSRLFVVGVFPAFDSKLQDNILLHNINKFTDVVAATWPHVDSKRPLCANNIYSEVPFSYVIHYRWWELIVDSICRRLSVIVEMRNGTGRSCHLTSSRSINFCNIVSLVSAFLPSNVRRLWGRQWMDISSPA